MALSANKILMTKQTPVRLRLKVVDGAIHIYRGANLSYEASNVGYVKLGTDTLLQEFAGIALEELDKSASENGADGTFDILVIPRGSGELVEMDVTSTITIANEGDPVYTDGDDKVDLAAGIVNTTNGFVGIIRQYISANKALVQLTQHPTL